MSVRCSSCQNVNRTGAKFCTKCGQSLGTSVPPPVSKTNLPGENTCPYCQQSLIVEKGCCVRCGAKIQVREKTNSPPKSEIKIRQARFCTKCGKPLRKTANFCTACGKAVTLFQQPSVKSTSRTDKKPLPVQPSKSVSTIKEKIDSKTTKRSFQDTVDAQKPPTAASKLIKPEIGRRRSPISAVLSVLLVALIGFGLYRYLSKPENPPAGLTSIKPTAAVSKPGDDLGSFDGISSAVESEKSEEAVKPNPDAPLIPAPLPVSGTRAVDQELFHGLTVNVGENQLDRDRVFSGYRLTDEEIYETALPLRDQGYLMIDAFEFSAQLGEGERLPNGVKIQFDLKAFDIPEVLWDDIGLVRLYGDGHVEQLRSKREGAVLTAVTDANSIVGAIALGTGIGLLVGKTIEHGGKRSWAQMIWRSFDDSSAHESFLSGSEDRLKNYSIYWPDDLPFTNKEKVKEITRELQALTTRHTAKIDESIWKAKQAGDSIGYSIKIREALVTMKSDPKYKDIVKRLSDPALVIPLPVQFGIQALVEADYYLYEVRKFKRPAHNVEVYFLDDWPHEMDVLGMAENPYLSSPYIHINISKAVGLPYDVAALKDSRKMDSIRTQIDDLQLTIMHELFHIAQAGYVWVDKSNYLWFWEATAVLLEKEAYEYGLKSRFESKRPLIDPQKTGNLISRMYTDILTTIFWETYAYSFGNPDDWGKSGDVDQLTTRQGYAASRFLEMMRDKYYRSNPDQFLLDLIQRFAASYAVRTDIQGLLRDQLGISAKTYEKDFVDFCHQEMRPIVSELMKRGGFVWKKSLPFLTSQKPKVGIEAASQSEFTAYSQTLGVLRDSSDSTAYRIGLRIKDYLPQSPSIWVISNPGKEDAQATAIKEDGIRYFPYKDRAYAVYTVMSVQPDAGQAALQMEAILLPQPEIPQLEIKGRSLSIDMPKKSFLFDQQLAEKWLVVFSMKTSAGSTTFALENDAPTLEIPLNDNGIIKNPADPAFKDKVIAAMTRYAAANPGSKQRTYDWDALQALADTPIKGKPDVVYTVAVMEMTKEDKPFYTQLSPPASIRVEFEEAVGHLEIIPSPCKAEDSECYFKWFSLQGMPGMCIIDVINSLTEIPIQKDGSFSFGAQGSKELWGHTTSCSFSVSGMVDLRTKKGTATMDLNMIDDYYYESDKFKAATGCTAISTHHYEYEMAGEATFDLSEKGGYDFEVYPGVVRRLPSESPTFYLNGTEKGNSTSTCDMFGGNPVLRPPGSRDEKYQSRLTIRFKFVPEH